MYEGVNWGDQETIQHGPSKGELMLGFFTRGTFGFRSDNSGLIDIMVNKVEAEDGSGESWNFEGYATSHDGRRVHGYWRTDRHHGYLRLEQRQPVHA